MSNAMNNNNNIIIIINNKKDFKILQTDESILLQNAANKISRNKNMKMTKILNSTPLKEKKILPLSHNTIHYTLNVIYKLL